MRIILLLFASSLALGLVDIPLFPVHSTAEERYAFFKSQQMRGFLRASSIYVPVNNYEDAHSIQALPTSGCPLTPASQLAA